MRMAKEPISRMISEMRTLTWWWHRTVETVVALLAVYILTGALEQRNERLLNDVPPEEWLEIRELYVPDHNSGSNPRLVFDRVVSKPFLGFWIAEVQQRGSTQADEFASVCTGIGEQGYAPSPTDPDKEVTWREFLGRDCTVAPGNYRIVLTFDLRVPGFPTKRIRALSNVFTVK